MTLYENKQFQEKALLVSVDTGDFDAEVSIDELAELADTAGIFYTTFSLPPCIFFSAR